LNPDARHRLLDDLVVAVIVVGLVLMLLAGILVIMLILGIR
jgi:hypothetical protein